MKTLIVIPARLASVRLPRKLLLAETGKPLIAHVAEVARSAIPSASMAVVFGGTEAEWIEFRTVMRGQCCLSGDHPNGTSRAAEFHESVGCNYDTVVILQADEPEIDPAHVRELVAQLEQHPEWDCATLGHAVAPEIADEMRKNRNRVTVFFDSKGECATNFTRGDDLGYVFHIGIYAYRTEALRRYAAAGPCERETAESLEQLRALHIGLRMGVVLVDHRGHGIDTREDYDAFVKRWREKHGNPSGN